ncbi:MAG: hypothetical protein B6D58_06435 [candidate division Zixibacteria bacterium 4484_95]|nr:MAG: hypothetical protein B6D58_06435 [candidate division Zixibacteria bacterium 4484_95]
MKIFLGGIIQGSNVGSEICNQNYREQIKNILRKKYPDVEIFDPFEDHRHSVNYDDAQARRTFSMHLDELKSSDLMIAYLPQASLGTAIEMWEACRNGVPIVSISPLTTNWIVRFLTDKNFETIDSFEIFVIKNDLRKLFNRDQGHYRKIGEKV